MQALNVAAILLTGSACSVLLLQARHRLLICRIPALVIFLLLGLPLYGILLYLHADTAEALLRSAVLRAACDCVKRENAITVISVKE